jgi:hypothetical protein
VPILAGAQLFWLRLGQGLRILLDVLCCLLLHHRLPDGRLHQALEGGRVVGPAVVAREQQRHELGAARQAADVRGQDIGHPAPIAFCRQYIQICRDRRETST